MAYINGKEILFSSIVNITEGIAREEFDAEKSRADAAEARANAAETEKDILSAEIDDLTAEKNELLDNFSEVIQGDNSVIVIPDNTASIREYAFYRHPLTSVKIPKTVTSLGRMAFASCSNCLVYDFTEYESVPTLASTNVFDGINVNAEIKVPSTLYNRWIAETNWSTYASYIKAVNNVIVIPESDVVMQTVSLDTALRERIGFYFSNNVAEGSRYVSHTYMTTGEIPEEYELSSASDVLTMQGNWESDNYTEGEFEVYGQMFDGTITFKKIGTYRLYQKYRDSNGNEYTTGSYIYEVTA